MKRSLASVALPLLLVWQAAHAADSTPASQAAAGTSTDNQKPPVALVAEPFAALAGSNDNAIALANAIRTGALALLTVVRFGDTTRYLESRLTIPDPQPAAVLATIREHSLEDKRLLVPHDYVPMLHYYFPRATLKGYERVPSTAPLGFDAVIQPGDSATVNVIRN